MLYADIVTVMISLISTFSKIQSLRTISSSSNSLRQGSNLLSSHEKSEQRLTENIIRRTHQDKLDGSQLIRNAIMDTQDKNNWRETKINEISRKILNNNKLLNELSENIQQDIEESKKDETKTEKTNKTEKSKDESLDSKETLTEHQHVSIPKNDVHIDILV